MFNVSGYTVASYGSMITDKTRTNAYVEALRKAVTPGCRVLDIGTGTGIFAFMACRFGAGRVYAIEPDDAIQVAREIANDNGFSDKIEFIQGVSTRVDLPEKVDIIIADIHGILPLYEQFLPTIIDARTRFLKPGGIIIPQKETMWAALVDSGKIYEQFIIPWTKNDYDIDMKAGLEITINSWSDSRPASKDLLTEPQCWGTFDYASIKNVDCEADMSWIMKKTGTAHGFALWFDSTVLDGISISNAPGNPELVYGSGFFPFSKPLKFEINDTVKVFLSANLVGEDYTWLWKTEVLDDHDPQTVKAAFKQSTFFGVPLTSASLKKRSARNVPVLSKEGNIDRFILELINGSRTLDMIAQMLVEEFPDYFASWEEALARAGRLSNKYDQS